MCLKRACVRARTHTSISIKLSLLCSISRLPFFSCIDSFVSVYTCICARAPLPVCLITHPHSDVCVIVLARVCFPRKLKHELNLFFRADNLASLYIRCRKLCSLGSRQRACVQHFVYVLFLFSSFFQENKTTSSDLSCKLRRLARLPYVSQCVLSHC